MEQGPGNEGGLIPIAIAKGESVPVVDLDPHSIARITIPVVTPLDDYAVLRAVEPHRWQPANSGRKRRQAHPQSRSRLRPRPGTAPFRR